MASVLVGIANFAIYFAAIDYMVAAYGPYAASATGGNGFARDLLAGMCTLYVEPMYTTMGILNSFLILFGLGLLFCIPVYVFYFKGVAIRKHSKFASRLAQEKKKYANSNSSEERTENVDENMLVVTTLQDV